MNKELDHVAKYATAAALLAAAGLIVWAVFDVKWGLWAAFAALLFSAVWTVLVNMQVQNRLAAQAGDQTVYDTVVRERGAP